MKRPFATSPLWLFAATLILIPALAPLDPVLSMRAQALPDAIVAFNRTITDFGTFRWMIGASAAVALLAWGLHRIGRNGPFAATMQATARASLYVFLTIGATSALVHAAKLLIGRARPELFAELGAYSLAPFTPDNLYHSFPSGHSAAVGALFGALAMLAPRLRPLFVLGALAIGVSRVVVGAHYPSDVAAGLLLGLWTAIAIAFLFARRNVLFRLDRGWPKPEGFSPHPPAGT